MPMHTTHTNTYREGGGRERRRDGGESQQHIFLREAISLIYNKHHDPKKPFRKLNAFGNAFLNR